jgi:hypothetical protein
VAQVFLTGRTLKSVTDIAKEINNSGGVAEAALVDALDEDAVEEHIASVVQDQEDRRAAGYPGPKFQRGGATLYFQQLEFYPRDFAARQGECSARATPTNPSRKTIRAPASDADSARTRFAS